MKRAVNLCLVLLCAVSLLAQPKPVEEAWALLAKGQRPQAIRLLYDIVKTNPRDADARLLLGSVLQEEGDGAGSIAQLTEAVRLRPRSAEAQNALGEAFNAFGEAKAARGPLEKAVALDPKFAQAHLNLGLLLLEAGDLDQAAGRPRRANPPRFGVPRPRQGASGGRTFAGGGAPRSQKPEHALRPAARVARGRPGRTGRRHQEKAGGTVAR